MERELFYKCLDDTAITKLLADTVGEEETNYTCNIMYSEFEDSVHAFEESYDCVREHIEAKRKFITNVANPDFNAFYKSVRDIISSIYGAYSELKASDKTTFAYKEKLLVIARSMANLDDLIAKNAIGIDIEPELAVFGDSKLSWITSLKKDFAMLERGITALPQIKLYVTNLGTEVQNCSIELTGSVRAAKTEKHVIGTLPEEVMKQLRKLRPETFASIDSFVKSYSKGLIQMSEMLIAFGGKLRYALNVAALIAVLRKNNIPLCKPRLSEKATDLVNVCDISLVIRRKHTMNISFVTNNVTLRRRDAMTLIGGAISSGKTSFIKTIAVCHLFFMLGLPVPAATGAVTPVRSINIFIKTPPEELDAFIAKSDDELNDALLLAVWPCEENRPKVSSDEKWASCIKAIEYLKTKNVHGIMGIRIEDNLYKIPQKRIEEVPEEIPLFEAFCDRDTKRTFRMKPIHRGEDERATDIVSRYGLDKTNLMVRFKSNSGNRGL